MRRATIYPQTHEMVGHAEPVIGRAFARPVGVAHPTALMDEFPRMFEIVEPKRTAVS